LVIWRETGEYVERNEIEENVEMKTLQGNLKGHDAHL